MLGYLVKEKYEIKVTTQLTLRWDDDLELFGKAQYNHEGPYK